MKSRRPVNSTVGRLYLTGREFLSGGSMFGMTWGFTNTTLALAIVFAIIAVVFHFKSKRDNISSFDKTLSHLRLSSFFFVTLIFVAMLYLPHAFYRDISPSAGQEALHDLIVNQQRMGEDLRQFQEILYVVFMMSVGYLGAITALVGRLYRERRKKDLHDDPRLKKPLGLEV